MLKKRGLISSSLSAVFIFTLLVIYGCEKNPVEPDIELPIVYTVEISDIGETTAKCGGTITSNGGATITACGVCWSTNQEPTLVDCKTNEGPKEGSFSSSITGISANTIYYVRAYATNSLGTGYGDAISFETGNTPPEIISMSINLTNIKVNDICTAVCSAIDPNGDTLSFHWEVTGGTLSGSGDSVVWTAPDSRAICSLFCTVSDVYGGVSSDSLIVKVSGWNMLYIGNLDSVSLTTPGGIYSHYQEIQYWRAAGYSVDVKNIAAANITDSLLANYDILDMYGWLYSMSADKGTAIYKWVQSGGNLLALINAAPMVPAVAAFGVDRIDGNHGGSSGLDWYFHGAPLLLGPVSGPDDGIDYLAAESMDRPVLTPGHHLTIDATKGGYPAVVHGEFGFGAVVIVFAGGWSHDATRSNNAYRSTIFQQNNIQFLQSVIGYLSN